MKFVVAVLVPVALKLTVVVLSTTELGLHSARFTMNSSVIISNMSLASKVFTNSVREIASVNRSTMYVGTCWVLNSPLEVRLTTTGLSNFVSLNVAGTTVVLIPLIEGTRLKMTIGFYSSTVQCVGPNRKHESFRISIAWPCRTLPNGL